MNIRMYHRRLNRFLRPVWMAFIFMTVISSSYAQVEDSEQTILKVHIDGMIDQNTFRIIQMALGEAAEKEHSAILLVMDTPGGAMQSMDDIIKAILNAKIPIITWVGPAGATCGSAGVFILYASHIAAMAPATNLGSATPLVMSPTGEGQSPQDQAIPKTAGTSDSVNLKRKLFHHAIAQIQGLAEFRNRNSAFAVKTITEAKNITSSQALRIGVIDTISGNERDLLNSIHGRVVRMSDHDLTLDTKNAQIHLYNKSWMDDFLKTLSSPQIAYILFMIGMLGIYAEFNNPGSIYPGVIGAICLLLGLYALHGLPLNYTGFALIGLGVILFILEIKITSYGLLSIGGILSITLGSFLLLKDSSPDIYTLLPLLAMGLVITVLMAIIVYKAARVQSSSPVSGVDGMIGVMGLASSDITPDHGIVRVRGEIWQARSHTLIEKGTTIEVVEINNLTLLIKKAQSPTNNPNPAY